MLNVGGLDLSIGQPALNCKQPNDYICFHSLHCPLRGHGRVGLCLWNWRQAETHLSGHLFLRGRSGRDWCDIYQERKENGEADVVFYPVLKKSSLEKYSEEQQKQLRSGKVILADTVTADGRKTKAFVQIDTETNQVMSVPTQVIARNLQVMAEELKLSNAEIKVMQQGEPLTFVMQDEPVTVGISLHEKDGIRFCQGDAKKWNEQTKREWDKYTFGCYGCWMMDDDGNLDYIPEEQYTEELWNEQKKSAQRNMGAGLHK